MTDYTPTTEEIRHAWQEYAFQDDGSHQDQFDRWLYSVIEEAEARGREQVWDED